MLARRPDPENNETLESYLLRLAADNHFRMTKLFPHFAKLLAKENRQLAGVLPTQLEQFNLYHAQQSSGQRYQAFDQLSRMVNKPILKLAILKSPTVFSSGFSSLHWQGIDIPAMCFRTDCIPICPECLVEKSFIPMHWHIKMVRACHKHARSLVFHCPQCGLPLNYIKAENIIRCRCGYDLRTACAAPAPKELIDLSACLIDRQAIDSHWLSQLDLQLLYGVLLWYFSCVRKSGQYSDEDCLACFRFFQCWPESLNDWLEQATEIELIVRPLAETSFQTVFGSLLLECRRLPYSSLKENPVLRSIHQWLGQVLTDTHPCIGYLLLNSIETAVVLNSSAEQVVRLVENGVLLPRHQKKKETRIHPSQPLFRLKDVYLLWQAEFQSYSNNRQLYLSRW